MDSEPKSIPVYLQSSVYKLSSDVWSQNEYKLYFMGCEMKNNQLRRSHEAVTFNAYLISIEIIFDELYPIHFMWIWVLFVLQMSRK